jgi:hypothetical protein
MRDIISCSLFPKNTNEKDIEKVVKSKKYIVFSIKLIILMVA